MRKSYTVHEDDSEIRKGPWTAEEDEILTNFVKKYGPRDWSSIRSKGLLPRTGKSCRLRWVNKLRPNLKVGCKFSAEEERLVVEMQSRIGNKWAAIASYLSGRTDNDVKNFWSSRKKRLARIFHSNSSSATSSSSSSASSSSSKLLRNSSWRTASKFKSNSPVNYQVPPSREDICTTMHVKQEASSASTTPCMMPDANIINMMKNAELSALAPESINPELKSLHSHCLIDPLITQPPSLSQSSVLLFSTALYQPPEQPPLVLDQSRDIPIVSAGLGCLDLYPCDAAVPDEFGVEPQFNIDSPFFGLDCGRVLNVGAAAAGVDMEDQLLATPDSFFDDFPTDVFDSLDPFPTSSER